MYSGIGASEGIGIGKVILIKEPTLDINNSEVENPTDEINRLKSAIDVFIENTKKKAENIKREIGEKESEILEGQIHMITDPMFNDEFINSINDGNCAEVTVKKVCDSFIAMFSGIEDELMKQRASDIGDIKTRLIKILLGINDIDISDVPKDTILVAKDFTPSMTASIVKENIAGIITEVGGKTSHSAILARALEIPAVLSVESILSILQDNDEVIIDGQEGLVIVKPNNAQIEDYKEKQKTHKEEKKLLQQFIGKHTLTKDKKELMLFGNIGNWKDAKKVVEFDGEGVGLFRTEFLFMDNAKMPTEAEQFEAYKKVALTINGKSVIIRTLDIGGDKEIPYLNIPKEDNPFLGYRAIRFCLDKVDKVYKPQLRAILRASRYGDIKIMVPLVTCVDELRKVKELVEICKKELDEEKTPYNNKIEIGVMIETPAASLIADILAKEADFFSIGTNDLTQYTMAVDRGNSKVAYIYSVFNPAVLRSIKHIIECANKEKIIVGMCGEAASDELLIPLLVGFGLDEFSVSFTSILKTRKILSEIDMNSAKKLVEEVMKLTTKDEVIEYLKQINKIK